ncbi:MAG TPA: efflux RND transporter periplasmic adaptor subunit [Acidobacteriota bacterium]|nr:efflux RND transporter periplasmic adaptor subunit [Acidobacteriota bacterium]
MRVVGAILVLGIFLAGGLAYFDGDLSRIETVFSTLQTTINRLGEQEVTQGPIRLTGLIDANQVMVSPKVAGRIAELRVQEGSWVEEGQIVATLDRAEIDAQIENHLARISQLAALLSQARDEVWLARDQNRSQVSRAEALLKVALSKRDQALADVEQTRKDTERAEELYEKGIVPRQEVERYRTALQVAEANLKALEDEIGAAQADLDLARTDWGKVELAQHHVRQVQAKLEQARADLKRTQAQLSYSEVLSPLSGMVSLRVARQGEVVQAGEPIVMIVDLDDIWVRADVEESYVGRLRVGQPLQLETVSGELLTGKIIFISPEAQFATQRDVSRVKRDIRTFSIRVQIDNPQRTLHPGMTAYVYLPEMRKDEEESPASGTVAP